MTRSEKIRDAILGISKEEIEKTEGSSRPVRLEDGKTLTEKKWRNMSDWAGCRQGEVVVYVDDTVLGNCKKGAVFTEEVFWNKEALAVSKENRKYFNPLRYAEIRGIAWSAKKSSTFVIQLEDAAVEVNGSIYAKFYAEALKRAAAAAGYTWAKENKAVPKKESAEKKVVNKSDVRPDPLADLNSLDYSGKSGSLVEQVARRAQERRIAEREQAEKMDGTPAPVGRLTLADVNARIAALEGELAELRAMVPVKETAAKRADEETTAKKTAAEPVQPKAEAENRYLWHAMQAQEAGNMEEACRYYQLGAEAGDLSCMENLALIYSRGQLVPQDAKKAMHWFDQSWLHGNTSFQFEAAQLAVEVARTEADLKKAEEWVERAEQDEMRLLDLEEDTSIDDLRVQIAEKRKALEAEKNKDVFSKAEAEEGYYCPACLKLCKPMAGCADHVCPYCGKVNRCTDLRKHKITQEDRTRMITENLKLKIRTAKGEAVFEPWDTNVPWNTDHEAEELLKSGLDMLFTIMSDDGDQALREAYKLGNMEAAYRLGLLHLTEWHSGDIDESEKDPALGREAARAAARKGHSGAIALCKVLKIPPEEKPAPTREQQKKLEEIKAKLKEIRRKHGSLIDRLKEKYYFLEMMGNTSTKEHESLFMEWLELVQQGEQLDDPFCIRELYGVKWSLKEHGFNNETYYTSRMAEMGDAYAMVLTGTNLSAGKGGKEDQKAALQYYRVAADMDCFEGVAAITRQYYDEKNKQGCLYWARKLAEYKPSLAYEYIAELSDDPAERAQAQAKLPGCLK